MQNFFARHNPSYRYYFLHPGHADLSYSAFPQVIRILYPKLVHKLIYGANVSLYKFISIITIVRKERSVIYRQQRAGSACTSVQGDQAFGCPEIKFTKNEPTSIK